LSTHFPGPLIARGRTAEVYAWQENKILKLFYDWCPAHWMEQEINVGRVMAGKNLPVPKLIDTLKIEGRQGIIYDRVEGPSMLQLSNSRPWLLTGLARQLAELHTEIHIQDGNGFPALRGALTAVIQQVEDLPAERKKAVLELLGKLPDRNALCHFDFHPGQVLISSKGAVVIDWMTACQGNPLADVARTALIFMVAQVPGANWSTRLIVNLWRGLFRRTYLIRYLELHPGVTRAEITTWMVPVAAGRLREGIPGEREALLGFIQSHLPTQDDRLSLK
jgi:aminoglycoside phosphotransferase (APT) family kinase protein